MGVVPVFDLLPYAKRRPAAVIAASAVAAAVALVIYVQIGRDGRYVQTGDMYPGDLTAVLAVVGYFVGALLGALVLGALVYVVIASRPGADGAVEIGTYRAHRLVERTSPVWALVALIMAAVTAADHAGLPVLKVISHESGLSQTVSVSEQAKAWCVVAVCAAIVAVVSRLSLQWTTDVPLLVPAVVAVVALPVAGNAGQGPGHDYGTSAAIVLAAALAVTVGVRVAAAISLRGDTPDADVRQTARRVLCLAVVADAVALLYSLVLGVILVSGDDMFSSAFGRAALLILAGLSALLIVDAVALRRCAASADPRRFAVVSAVVAAAIGTAVYAAFAVAETRTATALLHHDFSAWDVYLGYRLHHSPNFDDIVTTWRPDLLIGVAAAAAMVLYAIGLRRLSRDGVQWSRWRTLSWMAGCAALIFTSGSGLRTYGMAMFSVHMAEHMVLNMFVPVLLVLGAPVTLALQALPTAGKDGLPGPREWLTRCLHSPLSRFLTHPVVAMIIFVASLYAVYFTPLFDVLVRYHWGHEAMSIHFVVTGYLFYWSIIGIDPGPRRLPFLARLGLLFAVMPFHAFFGIATMTMSSIIGGTFYRSIDLPWVSNLQHDQFLGGAIAWGASEVPVIIVVLALVTQWAKSDRRAGARADRHADTYRDTELEAYNKMLSDLARDRR